MSEPRTVAEAVAARLADAAYRGAMQITDAVSDPETDSPLRRVTTRLCELHRDADRTADARALIAQLNEQFGLHLDPDATVPSTEPRRRRHGVGSVSDLLRRWAATRSDPFEVDDALRGITALGWASTSDDPLSTVRPLVAQLARDGWLARLQRGRYVSTAALREDVAGQVAS